MFKVILLKWYCSKMSRNYKIIIWDIALSINTDAYQVAKFIFSSRISWPQWTLLSKIPQSPNIVSQKYNGFWRWIPRLDLELELNDYALPYLSRTSYCPAALNTGWGLRRKITETVTIASQIMHDRLNIVLFAAPNTSGDITTKVRETFLC